jgi:MFS family permease
MGIASQFFIVAAVLALLGAGVGFFTPANQKLAFASVGHEDYGVLAAMLSSFGTAAGTVGTTIVVALMEMDSAGNLWASKEVFSSAQRFAFAWLVPIGLVAIVTTFRSRRSIEVQATAKGVVGR